MKLSRTLFIALAISVIAVGFAQDTKTASMLGPGTKLGGGLELLIRDDVAADIDLTGEQKIRLEDIRKKTAEAVRKVHSKGGTFSDLDALKEEQRLQIEATLKPEQVSRLRQIELQLQGMTAITYPEVAAALGLSEEQKVAVRASVAEHLKNSASIVAKVKDRQIKSDEARKQFNESYKAHETRLAAILSTTQADKLKEMQGKPFVPTPPPSNKIGG